MPCPRLLPILVRGPGDWHYYPSPNHSQLTPTHPTPPPPLPPLTSSQNSPVSEVKVSSFSHDELTHQISPLQQTLSEKWNGDTETDSPEAAGWNGNTVVLNQDGPGTAVWNGDGMTTYYWWSDWIGM